MANQFQDIIPPDKRSIRNIPLPAKKDNDANGRRSALKVVSAKSEAEILGKEKKEADELASRSKEEFYFTGAPRVGFSSKAILWCITAVAVLALFFATTRLFKSAEIGIVQKSASVALPASMTLYLNPKEGEAGYSTISVSDSATELVAATGEKEVSAKSSGRLVVYNNYSATTQRLVAGTRFETPSGLIFKLDEPATVPGTTKSNSKNVPGSIEVSVTASLPGAEYNIGLSDFTIPGFKGDPRYSAFYGRSKTAMSGGNVGKAAVIEDDALERAVAGLKEKLKASLLEKAQKQLPETQKIFEGFQKISYAVSPAKLSTESGAKKAELRVDGTAKIYAVDTLSFARNLLSGAGLSASSTEAFDLDFTLAEATLGEEANGALSVALAGTTTITWKLDAEAFKEAVAGKSVKEVPAIAASFPEIESVSVVIKPFSLWNSSLPANVGKISVEFDK